MSGLNKLKEQTLAFLKGLSSRAKVVIAVGLIATVAGLIYLMSVDRTSYTTLFSGLTTEDAAGITERLKKEKVPFRLAHGGTTVAVPEGRVHELRLRMAGEGLPRGGGVGFEIFDKPKLGASEFTKHVQFRRALQGELERTISQIETIKSARVHLVMPRRQLFARAQKRASASVTLRLRRGRTINKGQVKAVVHLVSSSVAGVGPEAVTVMDTRGRLLWSGKEGAEGVGDGVLDYRKRLETRLQRRVRSILDRALGVGKSEVTVTADTALSSSEQTEERFDPDQVAIRSESKAEEKSDGAGRETAGVAGVRGNLPGAKGPSGGRVGAGMKSKRLTRNYEISKTVRRQRLPAGELKRLSVAVLIDQRALEGAPPKSADKAGAKAKGKADGKGAAKAKKAKAKKAKPKIDLAALELIVQQAVGYSAARGDVVTLKAVPFADEQLPVEVADPTWVKVARSPYPYLAVAGLIAAVFFLLLLRRRKHQVEERDQLPLPATVRELAAQAPVTATAEAEDQLALEDDTTRARALAEAAAEHDARRAAQVLRVWLAGG